MEDDMEAENAQTKRRVWPEEMTEMIDKLERDHQEALRLKRDNIALRKKLEGLATNNSKMARVLENLDEKMEKTTLLPRNKLVYSFQEGGMVGKEDIVKEHLELKKKHVSIREINDQLNQIVSMMERKNIYKGENK